MRWLALVLALTAACSSDADGDGFDKEFDCDDSDELVNPEAIEYCDGIDNNCSSTTPDLPCDEDPECDEPDAVDAQLWYADFDDDGLGDEDFPAKACNQPEGWVDNADDCDDEDDTVGEVCP